MYCATLTLYFLSIFIFISISSPCPSVPPQWVRPQHGVMPFGKRPVSIFYRRHRHGVPRGGWTQAGTHHCLPLHWRSVARLFFIFLGFQQTNTNPKALSCLVPQPYPVCLLFAFLSLSFIPFHFLLLTLCPVFHSRTLRPTMLLFPSSLNHFLITSYQTFTTTQSPHFLSYSVLLKVQCLPFIYPPLALHSTLVLNL